MRTTAERLAHEIYKEAWMEDVQPSQPTKKIPFAKAAEAYETSGAEARFRPKLVRYFGRSTWIDDIDKTMIAQAANDLHPVAKPDTLRRQVRVPVRAIQNIVAR